MKNIGFIGIGVMGKSMAANLLKKGFSVSIYTRTKQKALPIIEQGALWCDTIADCVKDKDAVITMVGYPKDVQEVYFAKEGILENVKKGAYVIDMTTTSPVLSEKIYSLATEKGLYAVDAPVSGGDKGAENATLSIMAGGDKESFEMALPLFKALGTTIIYEGKAGSGQHTKMSNQIAIAGAIAGVCEAIRYGDLAGLDRRLMLNSIKNGAAGSWQMSNNGENILSNNFDPGFFIKHFIKDMKIASSEAEVRGEKLEALETVLKMYEALENDGLGDMGTQALIKYYEK